MCCVEGHSCPFMFDAYLELGTRDGLCHSSVQRTQWMEDGTESCVGDSIGHPITFCTFLWELVDGWTYGIQYCVEGHHGTSLDVPYVPWGLRDGMDKWDRRIVLGDTMEHPLMSHVSLGD